MQELAANPSFVIYAIAAVVWCLNLSLLWGCSGVVRIRSKTTLNPEDALTVVKRASVADANPPQVARALRAHDNALANIFPFSLLAFLYVVFGASPLSTGIYCGVFTLARLGHTFAYLGRKQPWRSLFFTIASTATVALLVSLVLGILHRVG